MAYFVAKVESIGVKEMARTLRTIRKDLTPGTSKRIPVLFTRVGRALRDDARDRITTQGEGKWPKLSKWTRAKTGRRKALITERKNIVYERTANSVRIFHRSPSPNWNLNMHAAGFTRPAVRKKVRIPLKQPKLLGVTKPYIILPRGSRATKTPARNVWGTITQQRNVFIPEVRKWMRETMKAGKVTASLRGIRTKLGFMRVMSGLGWKD
jgi:hypothetical protein